jgi:nucleoside-diphosphate-sugar epimerase
MSLQEVNVHGTKNVVDAYKRSGARRLVYVSTAGVYGRGPFSMAKECELPVRPESALSASRVIAEQLVLGAGGVVIRPHLVLGPGDHWVGPAILRALRNPGSNIGEQSVLHSAIDVNTLGAAIAEVATTPTIAEQIFHATQAPLSVGQLARMLRPYLSQPQLTSADQPTSETDRASTNVTSPERRPIPSKLLQAEHTFSSERLQRLVSVNLTEPFAVSATAGAWYHAYPA